MYTHLYVDAESDLLEISQIFLEETKEIIVCTFEDAAEALVFLAKEHVGAIISYNQVPGTDGIQLLVEERTLFGQILLSFIGRPTGSVQPSPARSSISPETPSTKTVSQVSE
jgi:DNA-binding response OmpR family regulator